MLFEFIKKKKKTNQSIQMILISQLFIFLIYRTYCLLINTNIRSLCSYTCMGRNIINKNEILKYYKVIMLLKYFTDYIVNFQVRNLCLHSVEIRFNEAF